MENENKKSDYLLAASIIVAALLISGAWIYTGGNVSRNNQSSPTATSTSAEEQAATLALDKLSPINADDHLRGDLNAPVKIIEFSDMECPFCKRFHQTLRQILIDYRGQVVLVYRHYPLEQLHSKAKQAAQAAECAAELGGNDKFWDFLDAYFAATPSSNQMDMTQLPTLAKNSGLDQRKFEDCQKSNRHLDKIEAQIKEAQDIGAQGTPFSIVISPKGKKYAVVGAYPYSDPQYPDFSMKKIVDNALRN